MSRGPDAGTLLRRGIERDAERSGCPVVPSILESTRWASATFVGARHRLVVEGEDDAAFDEWLAGLDEANLPLHGHLVADLLVFSVHRAAGRAVATIEALTVEG